MAPVNSIVIDHHRHGGILEQRCILGEHRKRRDDFNVPVQLLGDAGDVRKSICQRRLFAQGTVKIDAQATYALCRIGRKRARRRDALG